MTTREEIVAALRYQPQGTETWKLHTKSDERLFEITASMAPCAIGVGYHSPSKQWRYDCKLEQPEQEGYTADLQRKGQEDEDVVVQSFLDWWPQVESTPLIAYKTGTWQHPVYPWLAASPDRYLYCPEWDEVYLLEAKSRQNDNDAMDPSDGHFVQCQLQLACVPEAKGLFYVSANVRSKLTDTPMVICAVARNEDFINNEVIPRLQNYRKLVSTRVAPTQQRRKPQFLSYRNISVKRVYPC